jgi:hypothetical protein
LSSTHTRPTTSMFSRRMAVDPWRGDRSESSTAGPTATRRVRSRRAFCHG